VNRRKKKERNTNGVESEMKREKNRKGKIYVFHPAEGDGSTRERKPGGGGEMKIASY